MTEIERRLIETVMDRQPRRCALCAGLDTVQNPVDDAQLCGDCRPIMARADAWDDEGQPRPCRACGRPIRKTTDGRYVTLDGRSH